MFPSVSQDVHARVSALSYATEDASPGARRQHSATHEQPCDARSCSQYKPLLFHGGVPQAFPAPKKSITASQRFRIISATWLDKVVIYSGHQHFRVDADCKKATRVKMGEEFTAVVRSHIPPFPASDFSLVLRRRLNSIFSSISTSVHEQLTQLDREHSLGVCVMQRRRLDPGIRELLSGLARKIVARFRSLYLFRPTLPRHFFLSWVPRLGFFPSAVQVVVVVLGISGLCARDGVPGVSGGSAAESRTPFFIVGHRKLDTATLVKGRRQLQLNGGVLTQALARGLFQTTGTVGRKSKFVVPSCLRYTAQTGGRCARIQVDSSGRQLLEHTEARIRLASTRLVCWAQSSSPLSMSTGLRSGRQSVNQATSTCL